MQSLYAELSARFPEIAEKLEDNRELPYLQMHEIVDWLASLTPKGRTSEVIARIISFSTWCEEQPRADDPGTDIFTIFVVGFLEKLIQTESTRSLLPHVIPKERMIENADYLRQWVGVDEYNGALALYT